MPRSLFRRSVVSVMELREIIDEIASQADDFLANANERPEAKLAVAELIEHDYPELSDKTRRLILTEVMRILEQEDFFVGAPSGDRWQEETDDND